MSQYCRQALLQTDKPNQTNGPRKLDEQIDVALHRRSATRDGSEHVDGRHAVFEQEISLIDEAPFDGIERHAHSVTESAGGDAAAAECTSVNFSPGIARKRPRARTNP